MKFNLNSSSAKAGFGLRTGGNKKNDENLQDGPGFGSRQSTRVFPLLCHEPAGEWISRQFHATKVLGNGGFAVVKLGTHDITGREVALKIMSKELIGQLGAANHVAREIRNLQLCSGHPNVVSLYDVVDENTGSTILAQEYCSGGELLEYMIGQKISPAKALNFFQQLVGGLEFIHSKGIIHRDIKPENLLLDASRTKVKIADFGFSCMVSGDPMVERLSTHCGSPNHVAPEILSKGPYVGPPVDVWSLGVVLYCMLVGGLPFHGEGADLYRKVREGDYYVPHHLAFQRKEVLIGMLCVDPVKRLSLRQIKEKAWFKQQELPPCLTRTVEEIEQEEQGRRKVDTEVINEVMTIYAMDSSETPKRTDLEQAAAAASDAFDTNIDFVTTKSKTDDDAEQKRMMKDLQVSYRLILDGKPAKEMSTGRKAVNSKKLKRQLSDNAYINNNKTEKKTSKKTQEKTFHRLKPIHNKKNQSEISI